MPITNHAELVAAMQTRMNRTDLATTAADAIVLYEAEANRLFRAPQMLVSLTVASTGRFVPLPLDYLQLKRLTSVSGGTRRGLIPVGTELAARLAPGTTTAAPAWYDIVDEQIELLPEPASPWTVEVVYYQRIPALTLGTNWLILQHPDVYLYGALKHLAILRGDDQRLVNYKTLYDETAASLARVSKRAQYGSALQIRPA